MLGVGVLSNERKLIEIDRVKNLEKLLHQSENGYSLAVFFTMDFLMSCDFRKKLSFRIGRVNGMN